MQIIKILKLMSLGLMTMKKMMIIQMIYKKMLKTIRITQIKFNRKQIPIIILRLIAFLIKYLRIWWMLIAIYKKKDKKINKNRYNNNKI